MLMCVCLFVNVHAPLYICILARLVKHWIGKSARGRECKRDTRHVVAASQLIPCSVHCRQSLVNLLLTGAASANVFNESNDADGLGKCGVLCPSLSEPFFFFTPSHLSPL